LFVKRFLICGKISIIFTACLLIKNIWLAIQGTPILEIKELLGHATLAMTERYAHLIPDQKRVSIARMEKAFLQSTNHQEKTDGQSSEPDGSDTKLQEPE
jgi:hypothetical protein